MTVPANITVQSVINDPACSTWLKASLIAALGRDPVDAANDGDLLAELLNKRCIDHFGYASAMTKPKRRGLGQVTMMDRIDWPMVEELRGKGISWRKIAANHKDVEISGRPGKPSEPTIRLLYAKRHNTDILPTGIPQEFWADRQ
tara:strand:+ start:2284 stop:2718 length:435 start_codon:yes stop_codon:yes gene_type:complete